ncbi:class I tRNA ligase family protein, partial [Patescibacteria group bacterium]|nr:class I tRNA ligase family protein [Patescibacteria group bacterium]
GFITGDGGIKMSKTLGNVVDPTEVVKEYGTDALRFFLAKEISNFEDSPFTIERFKDAYNSGLANGIGNLVSRIMTLSEKYLTNNRVVELLVQDAKVKGVSKFITDELDNFNIQMACILIWSNIAKLDKRISDEEVFKLIKTDVPKAEKILQDYIDKLATIAYELEFILPQTSKKIIETMKANKKPETPLFMRKD